jgi:hypothetical protein
LGTVLNKAAGFIGDHFPRSPAKIGPLSGRGDLVFAGQKVIERLVAGLTVAAPSLDAAVNDAARTVGNLHGLDVNNVRVNANFGGTTAGASSTTLAERSSGNSYNIHLPVVPFTAEQVGREAVQQLRNLELVYG